MKSKDLRGRKLSARVGRTTLMRRDGKNHTHSRGIVRGGKHHTHSPGTTGGKNHTISPGSTSGRGHTHSAKGGKNHSLTPRPGSLSSRFPPRPPWQCHSEGDIRYLRTFFFGRPRCFDLIVMSVFCLTSKWRSSPCIKSHSSPLYHAKILNSFGPSAGNIS